MKSPSSRRWKSGKSEIHGSGAFATEEIPEGEYVDMLVTRLNAGGLFGGEQTKLGRLLNHQSDPNGRMERVPSTLDQYYLKSMKSIAPGSEITMDYNDSPPFVATPEQIDPEGYKDWK